MKETCRQQLQICFSACFFDVSAIIRPVGAPAHQPCFGQCRLLSQSLSWQTGPNHHQPGMPIDYSYDPRLDETLNCWPLNDHHYSEDFAVSDAFKKDYLPLWSGLFSLSTRAGTLRKNQALCLDSHEDNHCFKQCRHPSANASGCLNTGHGQLGDDDVYRRWPARIICYHRDGKVSRPNNHKNNCRHHSGRSREYRHDQVQVSCHNDNTYTSDHHGDIPPSLASSAPAPDPEMRVGAAHNPGENPNARQPGIFRAGN